MSVTFRLLECIKKFFAVCSSKLATSEFVQEHEDELLDAINIVFEIMKKKTKKVDSSVISVLKKLLTAKSEKIDSNLEKKFLEVSNTIDLCSSLVLFPQRKTSCTLKIS